MAAIESAARDALTASGMTNPRYSLETDSYWSEVPMDHPSRTPEITGPTMTRWTSGSIEGQYVYLTAVPGNDRLSSPMYRVFHAEGGFGCDYDALGTKVFGVYPIDGSREYVRRGHVEGILTPETAAIIIDKNIPPVLEA